MASVTPPGLAYEVEHDQVNHRFTARVRGQVALLEYQIKRRRMVITPIPKCPSRSPAAALPVS